MSDQPAIDDTRLLRNAQANLIAAQSQRIAILEARLDAAARVIVDLQAENKQLLGSANKGLKGTVQA